MSSSERLLSRCARILIGLAAALLGTSAGTQPPAQHAEFVLVAASSASGIDLRRETVEQLYLGRRTTSEDGRQIQLIDLPAGPARDHFYRLLTGKNPSQIRAYWSRLVFTGRAVPPREADSPEQLGSLLSQIPNSIGYLPGNAASDPRLRVLLRLN